MKSERKPNLQEFLSNGEHTLMPGVFFVPGALRGALYDINTGRVFSINPAASNILKGQVEHKGFWNNLEQAGLATREKFDTTPTLPDLLTPPNLQFTWFEIISDDCNESCIHCYAESMPPAYRKAQNIIPIEPVSPKQKLTANRWRELIQESYELGSRACQFIGGEPFIYRGEGNETVLDFAEYAKNMGYESVEIFTNGTLLTKDRIRRIADKGINIAVSLYSNDPLVHDRITKTPGSHKKTMDALSMLKAEGVNTRIEIVLMRQNETTVEQTVELVDKMGFPRPMPDVLRPKGRGSDITVMPSKESIVRYGLMTAPNFSVDRDTLSRYLSGNSCLLGKITITDNGDILPCIFSRNLPIGNVENNHLSEIINGEKLETIWRTTKDNVLVCQDCEYRYVCFDCRPLSEGVNAGRGNYLNAPYPRCTYNPYTGEWAKGLWRVDENGKPYYDETIRPTIEEVINNGQIINLQPRGH